MRLTDTIYTGTTPKLRDHILHKWRVFATGLSFLTFGLGGIVLSTTFIPLLYLLIWKEQPRKRIAREIVRLSFRGFTWWMQFLGVVEYKFDARELKQARGHIIIANHPTLIDVVAMISLTRNPDCIVKAELFRNPFMRVIIRSTGYINNANPDLLIKDCQNSLEQGNNLIIFPEGTRTQLNTQIRFQRGAANIAIRTGAPILACKITCVPSVLRKHEPWYSSPIYKPQLAIRYMHSLEVDKYRSLTSASQASRQLTRDLETIYRQV